MTDGKLYVLVVTISNQENTKLLQQLKLGFKRTFNWNKYQSKVATESRNQYLYYLINPIFQGVNRLFGLSFENNDDRTGHIELFLRKVEIKYYNFIINNKLW